MQKLNAGLNAMLTLLGAEGWTPEVPPYLNGHDFASLVKVSGK